MQWNVNQEKAIIKKDNNILVSAAAGSGKTAVLVERIIRRILDTNDPLDLERVLVVTFTEAAAAEMRQRIGREIQKKLDDEPENRYLRQQLHLLNKAAISTIHSFCLEVVRKYFYRLDLDPGFRVADANEVELIRLQIMDRLFEDKYAVMDREFLRLTEAYGGTGGKKLKDLIFALFDYARSQAYPQRWLEQLVEAFSLDSVSLDDFVWVRELKQDIALRMEEAKWCYDRALSFTEMPGGPYQYADIFSGEREKVELLLAELAGLPWEELWSRFQGFDFQKLKPARDVDEHLKQKAKTLRDRAKDIIQKKIRDKYFSRVPESHLDDLKLIYPLVKTLVSLTKEFGARFAEVKREKSILDFADLEQFCFRLLVDDEGKPTDIATKLRLRFEEVLVDEYQDVNVIQNAILEAVARQRGGGYMFMVGDVKQSIYRFRLAEPGLFMDKEQQFNEDAAAGELIQLNTNYRSRRHLIDGVNYIFRQLMDRRVGDIDYGTENDAANHFLKYGDLYPETPETGTDGESGFSCRGIELHVLQRETETESGVELADDFAGLDALEKEALVMAKKIKQLVAGDEEGEPAVVWDGDAGSYRPVTYRDIVVLLRSTRHRVNRIAQIFQKFDIPVYADVTSGYFSAVEVETMLALLNIIDNPQQDIPLAAVLRSPIVGLKGRDLAKIRCVNKYDNLYCALTDAAQDTGLGELQVKTKKFLERLERWRTLSRREPLSSLIWDIYRETGFLEYCGGLPRGEQRQANLRALYDRARQFDRFVFQGLFRFLHYVRRLRESAGDLGAARALGENEDVVRIMSIHKSKGLEFPVVFLADMGKKFNMQDTGGDLLFHQHLGIGLNVVDSALRLRYPTLAQMAVKSRLERENLAEEMRVLYVGLTRAREQLILVGSVNGLEKWRENLGTLTGGRDILLPSFYRARVKTYLDWVCGSVVRHKHGRPLYNANLPKEEIMDHPSKWSVQIWTAEDLIELDKRQKKDESKWEQWHKIIAGELSDRELTVGREIENRLTWRYPARSMVDKAAKVSVSELKRKQLPAGEEEPGISFFPATMGKKPRFIERQRLSAAERGTAVHLVMQHLHLDQPVNRLTVQGQVDAMVARELLTPEQADAVPVEKIVAFFHTRVGRQMLEIPRRVYREQPFSLGIPAGELYPELADGLREEKVLVQGVIDCFLKGDTGLILIDFKTDQVAGTAEKIKDKYRRQISLYSRALAALYKQPVVQSYLYFFATEELISF